MENVMDMMRGPMMGDIFGKISGLFRESPEGVKRGFESAVPVSMVGLADQASTQEGAQQLLSTLKGGQYPHLDASELGRAVADPDAAASVARSGEGFLSRLFGNKQRGVVDGLASSAGVSSSTASKLLGLALPMVLGFVGKQAASRNMDASGLRGFLTSQRKQVSDYLPGPLSRVFGGGEAEAPVGVSRAGAAVHEVPGRKSGIGRYLLLALAIVAGLWLLLARRARHAPSIPQSPQTQQLSPPQQLGGVGRPQTLIAGRTEPLAQAIAGNAPLPQRFVLTDLTFRFDSAEIDTASARVLDDVAQLMTANPMARIRVDGYTDDVGTRAANVQLSKARADSARAYLINRGVPGTRIDTMGFGPDHPLASNDLPAGRAENRRTEIVVLQR
jgi:outer membrane protein OmpA-like peptidoglycan-associated protein